MNLIVEVDLERLIEEANDPFTKGVLRGVYDHIWKLERWKQEATDVIEQWEAAWEAAGCPGNLGQLKSDAMAELIRELRSALALKDGAS